MKSFLKSILKKKSAAHRMSDLIKSILNYRRFSKTDHEYSLTDLNKILHDVQSDFELLIKEKGAIIKSDTLPVIKADALQMQQLFSNLIGNSLKFSKTDPWIKINSKIVTGDMINVNSSILPKQKFVQLTFSDNGIGFRKE